jgi:hypothetical protein
LTLPLTKSREEAISYLENNKDNLIDSKSSSQPKSKKNKPPLSDKQMQVLNSLLQAAIIDTEQHNATFSVIKAITSTRYVSSKYYALIENEDDSAKSTAICSSGMCLKYNKEFCYKSLFLLICTSLFFK